VSVLGALRGSSLEHAAADELAKTRELRVKNARRNSRYWHELDEVDLVRRGPFLVSATTDSVFTSYRGTVFARGSRDRSPGSIEFDEMRELWFYVMDGNVVLLERHAKSWSAIVERRAKRQAS
jgi:hypothetical protein